MDIHSCCLLLLFLPLLSPWRKWATVPPRRGEGFSQQRRRRKVGVYIQLRLHGNAHKHKHEIIVSCPQTCIKEVAERGSLFPLRVWCKGGFTCFGVSLSGCLGNESIRYSVGLHGTCGNDAACSGDSGLAGPLSRPCLDHVLHSFCTIR